MKHPFPLAILLLTLAVAPVRAETLDAQLVAQLQAQGYSRVEVSHTLLGRLRITATLGDYLREIVVNPRTGEILRDYQSLLPRYAGNAANRDNRQIGATTATVTGDSGTEAPELLDRSHVIGKDAEPETLP